MRIPVFARRSNPSIDRPILRKKLSYAEAEVKAWRAAWVDPADPRKGIICREMLVSEKRLIPVETVTVASFSGELPGLRYIPAPMITNPTIARLVSELLPIAAPKWDWSQEPVSA